MSSIVIHVDGNSRELAQLIGSKRYIRRKSSFDPFALISKPIEWGTDGLFWLLEWLVKYVMHQVSRLAVALFYGVPAMVLLLVLLKEHMSLKD